MHGTLALRGARLVNSENDRIAGRMSLSDRLPWSWTSSSNNRTRSVALFEILEYFQCGVHAILRHEQRAALHPDSNTHNERLNIHAR